MKWKGSEPWFIKGFVSYSIYLMLDVLEEIQGLKELR